MATPDYQADIVPRSPNATVRLASFNLENLFSRPIAMDYEDFKEGQPYLDAYHELNSLFAHEVYSDEDKDRILFLMKKHKLTGTRPNNKHLEFRKIRGQLLKKKGNTYEVTANGRADWVGWVELKERAISDKAILNTARVIAAVDADILLLVEVEDRPGVVKFHKGVLTPILEATGRQGYPYILVIDGNDDRGIDVGVLSRFPITDISTHIFDRPGAPPVFARDCAEYFLDVPGIPGKLIVMVNHFSSKGSDPTGSKRRVHQATLVKEIIEQRLSQGFTHIVVGGDLNDTPASTSLEPLLSLTQVADVVKTFATTIDPSGKRLGTYETGKDQIDYLLLTEPLMQVAVGAGVERRGHYAPRTFKSFDTVSKARDQASDHHCIWVDLAI